MMNDTEPETTVFSSVTTQTNKIGKLYQAYLDQSTPFVTYRWAGTATMLILFFIRIIWVEGWYIVAYSLGIYLLNLFLAFLTPKFDPSMAAAEADDGLEGGSSSPLPRTTDDEFRPFIRRLPEFKFWHSATRAILIAFGCSWFEVFNVPVFWPVLVVYWIILFCLTMRRQIQHMIKYRYVPFSFGKKSYNQRAGH